MAFRGDRLEGIRKVKGLGLRELATMVGMDPAGLQRLENGDTKQPRYDTVEALAEKLNLTPEYLGGAGPDLPFERAAVLQALERFKRTDGRRFSAFNDQMDLAAAETGAPDTVAGWMAFMNMSAAAWGKRPAPAKITAGIPSRQVPRPMAHRSRARRSS